MFFLISLDKSLVVPPKNLGPKLQDTLIRKLKQSVEGTCSGSHGFIINVMKVKIDRVDELGDGLVRDNSGDVVFNVKYQALVFRPFKGEVFDGVVEDVGEQGIFVSVGPLNGFISKTNIPPNIRYFADKKMYLSDDSILRIGKTKEVRFRVVGMRIDASDIYVVGTINEDYLGLLS